MRLRYTLLFLLICFYLPSQLFGQCPPPGFPDSGDNCGAPIICENLDGYCNTINNNNVSRPFPCCQGWTLNNDEWFGFFAGTTSISIEVTPSNCDPGGQQGLQGGIYETCPPGNPSPTWCNNNVMDTQCSCTENPFTLSSNDFVVGQVYWIVLDGCSGNVCDYSIDVTNGSTIPSPPDDPGEVEGPGIICQGTSGDYQVDPVEYATTYTWTLTPSSAGTMSGGNDNSVNVAWSSNFSGSAQLCLKVANACYMNDDTSCITVNVLPKPTATLSGSGVICANSGGSVDLTVTLTGEPDWRLVYAINGVPQPPVIVSSSPYIITMTQPGTVTLVSVASIDANPACGGTVSGSAVVTQVTLNPTSTTVSAVCGQNNGSVDLSISGGNNPYSYSWSGGETTQDLSGVPPGTYTATITDNNGCTATHTVTVNDNITNPNLTAVVVNNTTCINGNGSIDLSVSPSGMYTYNWSNSATTQDLSNLPPGDYTVTVTQGVTCSATGTFTVADNPNNPTVNSTVTNTTCDLANGSINTSVTGGVAPYTYLWGDGETSQNLSNIPAGSYTLTVTGANGCTGTANITVSNNNPPINLSATTVANTTCNGGNGSIDLSAGPGNNYTYTWSGGQTTQDLSNLPPGNYTVTVSAGGTCTAEATYTVADNPNLPNPTATPTQTSCDFSNGSINASVSGGVPPYTFNWSTGATTEDLSNIPTGNYVLTVTGANGCTQTISVDVTNNNPPINVTATAQPNTVCNANPNGSIDVSVSPAGNYTYTWDNGTTTQDLSGVGPGSYTVTVSAGGSCTQVATFNVPANPNEPNITPSVINTSCDFSNGSINLSVSGGPTPYTFLWGDGTTTQNLASIPTGTYNVTVTAANGCTNAASIVVSNVNPPLDLTATTQPNTNCNGNNNGSINLTATPAGNYTYTWSNGTTTQDLSNIPAGDYSVTVSGGGSCTAVANYTVDFDPNEPNLTVFITNANCGLANGAVNLNVTGGVSPYTYNWSSGQTVQDLTAIPAGTYDVTVTGANACTNVLSAFVNDDVIPINASATIMHRTSCLTTNGSINLQYTPLSATLIWSNGSTTANLTNLSPGDYTVTISAGGTCTETATYTVEDQREYPVITAEVLNAVCTLPIGEIDLTVDYGITPYTYDWQHIPGTSNIPDLLNLPAGNYAVTVTTAVGCTEVLFVPIDNELLPVEVGGFPFDDFSCTSSNGYIDLEVTPQANYTYNWAHIPGPNNPPDLINLGAGTYSVTATYGTCNASATFEILDAAVAPNVSISPTAATCGQSDGSITLSVSGATAPYTFNWQHIPGPNNPANITGLAPGTYTVTVTDFFDCTATASAVVLNSTIAVNITGVPSPNTSCASPNGSLDISISPNNTYTYDWSNMATTQDLNGVAPGLYTVTVSAGVGCSASATFQVGNNTINPIISPAVIAAICSQNNGSIDLTISSGVSPYSFNWSNAGTTEDLNNIFPGNYSVTVTDANSCTADTTLNVANNASTFSLSGTATPYSNCATVNGAVDLVVTPAGPYTYLWSNGETTQDLNNVPAGTYTVEVTEQGTCVASATYFVLDTRSDPTLNQTIAPELCNLNDAGIDLSILGGVGPFTFNWSSGQSTEDLSGIGGGAYDVTVTGSNNCTATASLLVPENDLSFALSANATPNSSCVVLNGAVDLDISPAVPSGGPGYTYSWSSGQSTQDLSAIPAGTYEITVSAGGTCTNTAVYVVADDAGSPSIAESINQALCGQSSGSINISINGGTSPYTYLWSNASTDEDLSDIPAGNYAVTVVAANGCQVTESFTVIDGVITPTLSGIPQPNTACVGPNGSVNLSISPSSLNYTIQWSNGATTQNLDNLTAGTYTVVVNGGGACTASAVYNVANNTTGVVVSGTDVDILCFGDNTGAINLNASGGTQPFTYNWSPNLGNIEDPSSLLAGNYGVTITDAVGCTATASFLISQPAAAVQTACTALTEVSQPGSTDGTGQVQISGGVAPYTVLWSPGGTQNNVPAGAFPLNNLGVGSYDVTVTDANGCTADCGLSILLTPCVTALGSMGDASLSLCGTGCITANYDALGQFLDPNDLLQFVLHTGSGATIVNEIARNSTPTFCFNPAKMTYGTTYYVSAIAGNNDGTGNVNLAHYCTVITTGTPIVFYEKPVAAAAAAEPITCVTLQVGIAGSSSMPNSTFLWATINGTIVGNNNQANIQANEAGDYTLIVEANGCKDTTAAEVLDIRNDPVAEILASPDDILDCVIDEIILAGEVKGSGNANAIWYDQVGNTYPGGTVLQIDDPGTYWFAIVDTVTFCTDTASIVIGENQIYPPLFINPPAVLTCSIGSVTLSGGSPINGIDFTWATINGQDTVLIGNGSSVSVNQPSTYYLLGVDPVNGCNNIMSVVVVADQSFPTAEAGNPFSMDCFGETATLTGSATGGTGALTYGWTTNGGAFVTGVNTPTPTISEPGTYTLLVTSTGNGCSDTDVVVIAPNEPRALATVDNPACVGQPGTILVDPVEGAKPPITYTLTGGPHSQTGNFFSNLAPGNYSIQVVDADGCSTVVNATVIQPPVFEVTVDPLVTVQLGDSYQVDATVNVPETEIASITWTPPTWLSCDTCLSTSIVTPLQSQQYKILVVTKEGCKDDAALQLRVNRQVKVYIPNIFSPNDDGENDWFTVYADIKGVKQIKQFQIFDRWGDQIFQRENFQPNDPTLGWDGRFRGQEMNPAVFVYYAIVEFIDGQEVLFKGDVTLKR